jgi:hypothetical protein
MDRMQYKNKWCFTCDHAPVVMCLCNGTGCGKVNVQLQLLVGDYLAHMYNKSREGQTYEPAMKNHLNRLSKTLFPCLKPELMYDFVSRNGSHQRDMACPCNQMHNVAHYSVSKTRLAPNKVSDGGQAAPAAPNPASVIQNRLKYSPSWSVPHRPQCQKTLAPLLAGLSTLTLSIRALH